MADKDAFIAFFAGYGVTLQPNTPSEDGESILSVNAKQSPVVEGYSGFCVDFVFDEQGAFVRMGIWE